MHACVWYLHLAWKLWKQFAQFTKVNEIIENETRPEQKEYLKKNKGKVAIVLYKLIMYLCYVFASFTI